MWGTHLFPVTVQEWQRIGRCPNGPTIPDPTTAVYFGGPSTHPARRSTGRACHGPVDPETHRAGDRTGTPFTLTEEPPPHPPKAMREVAVHRSRTRCSPSSSFSQSLSSSAKSLYQTKAQGCPSSHYSEHTLNLDRLQEGFAEPRHFHRPHSGSCCRDLIALSFILSLFTAVSALSSIVASSAVKNIHSALAAMANKK